LIKNRPEGTPLHCVSIKGCSKTKQVIGYVEYFGVQRVILCLSDSYEGDDISNTCAINPTTGQESSLMLDLELSNADSREAYDYTKIPEGSVEAPFHKVIPTCLKASFEKEKDRVLSQAVKHAFENCGAKEGEMFMPEHVNKSTELMMAKLQPFILHQFA